MMFRETIAVYYESQTKHTNEIEEIIELLNFRADGTYTDSSKRNYKNI
jgi:hypothetical protein